MSTVAQSQQSQNSNQPKQAGVGYDVSRAQNLCHVTGESIAPGEKLMAALRETPVGFERLDISLDAWKTFDRKDVLAFWQTVMPSPQQVKKKLFVDDQVLCELFERLGQATDPAKLNFRFVLGLILMRKRMIIYESTQNTDEKEVWKVRFKGRDDLLDLINPRLGEQQVADVSKQLGEILNEEL